MNPGKLLRGFHEDEGGQVTILFVFASVGFILMLAFIVNTAQQTSRKIQMQDAADATAVVGATWMARGMNLIAFDNKAMADIVGTMIDIHAAREATDAMPFVIPEAAAPLLWCGIGEKMLAEIPFWTPAITLLDTIDTSFQNTAWEMLGALSDLNVGIAELASALAFADGEVYGNRNGLPGTIGVFPVPPLPVSQLPVMRGGKERLVYHANQSGCCLSFLEPVTIGAMCIEVCLGAPLTFLLWIPLFSFVAIPANIASLEGSGSPAQTYTYSASDLTNLQNGQGQSLQTIVNQYNSQQSALPNGGKPTSVGAIVSQIKPVTVGFGTLQWPNPAPQPMILTDTGNPTDTVDGQPPPIDLMKVRSRLQYLAVTRAPSKYNGFLAGDKFMNPAGAVTLGGWVTYAEADVYNPVNWDMFQQTWRARLARATTLGTLFGLDISLVNNH